MPTAEITIEKVNEKTGSGTKGPWTKYGIKAAEGEWFNTFNETQGELAKEHAGSETKFKVTYEEGQYGNDLKELALVGPIQEKKENGAKPNLGDGSYVKGQTSPADRRSMNASVALKEAVAALAHTIPTSATAKDVANKIDPLWNHWFKELNLKSRVAETEDISFGNKDEDIPF